MKVLGLFSIGLSWAMLSLVAQAESTGFQLAQSPTLPAPASPPELAPPVTLPPPGISIPSLPLNTLLFAPLSVRTATSAISAGSIEADQELQRLWEQARELKEDSPEFPNQVLALLQSLPSIEQRYQSEGDLWGKLKVLETALKLHYLSCQDQETLEIAQEALSTAASAGDPQVEKNWTTILSQIYWALGEQKLAVSTQQQLLDRLQTQNGKLSFFEAYDLVDLGDLYLRVGQQSEAIAAYTQAVESAQRPSVERSLDVYYAPGYTFKQAAIAKLLALYEAMGDTQQVEYWTQQQRQSEQAYEQFNRAADLMWGHLIATGVDDRPPSQRKPMLEEALSIFRQIGDVWGELDALVALSTVEMELQNYSQAVSVGEEALARAITSNDFQQQKSVMQLLVQAYFGIGQDSKAQAIQRDYEQLLEQRLVNERSRPRFLYNFAMPATYDTLAALHETRRCPN